MSGFDIAEDEFEHHVDDWIDEALRRGEGFKSEEERQAYIKSLGDPFKHPMFAQTTEDLEGHPLTEAFRALREEDKSPLELALMYKDEGNEWIKKKTKKDLNSAYDCYSHALKLLDDVFRARDSGEGVLDARDANADLEMIRSQILANRAQCSLTLKNYRYCITDCITSVAYWPQNIKAHFRLCKALHGLRRYQDAVNACHHALSYDANNLDIISIKESCQTEITRQLAKEQLHKQELQKLEESWTTLWQMLQQLQIRVSYPSSADQPQQLKNYLPQIGASEHEGELSVKWPVLFLYPQYNQIDLIEAVDSHDMLAEHLAVMFPEEDEPGYQSVAWDKSREYTVSRLVCYVTGQCAPEIKTLEEWIQCQYEQRAIRGEVDFPHSNSGDSRKAFHDRISNYQLTCRRNVQSAANCILEVHLGCEVLSLLKFREKYVLPGGLLSIIVFPRGNEAHKKFMRDQLKEGYHFIKIGAMESN